MHMSTLVIVKGPIECKKFTEEEKKEFKDSMNKIILNKDNPSYADIIQSQILREKKHWFCGPVASKVEKILDKYYVDSDDENILEYELYDDLEDTWKTFSEYFIKKPDGAYVFPKWNDNFIIAEGFGNEKSYNVFQVIKKNIKSNSMPYEFLKRTKAARKMKVVEKKFSDIMDFEKFKSIALNITDYISHYVISTRYGYFYNPYGLYDSYCIGSHVANSLLVRNDVDEVYEYDDFRNWNPRPEVDGYKWVTAAYAKDIDFEKMKELNEEFKSKYIITENDMKESNTIDDIKDSINPYDVICAVDMHI